jgi:Fe-S cluster assembly protein SufD
VKKATVDYKEAAWHDIKSLPMNSGDWLIDRRLAALDRFEEVGFPNPRLEEWRYTRVEGLLEQGFLKPAYVPEFNHSEIKDSFLQQPISGRLVLVDGLYQADLSWVQHPGIRITGLRSAMAEGDRQILEAVGMLTGLGDDGFSALNLASFTDGAVIQIKEGVKLPAPLELLHLTTAQVSGCKLPTRHLILMGARSEAELIERCMPVNEKVGYFSHLVYEINLAEAARLSHKRIQMESPHAYHLSDLHIALQGSAHYRGVNASVGGAWSRTVLHNRFQVPDSICELDGLYLVGDAQLSDFHLDIDHQVPHCTSRENFKGIVYGSGKAVFDGLIQVREQAQKSEAHLHNANLLLSRRGEVDTKPQLMILADDVACSHGASVGQLDELAVFYMRSRGLDEQQAMRLLCQGFVADVVERFEHRALTEIVTERMGFITNTQ